MANTKKLPIILILQMKKCEEEIDIYIFRQNKFIIPPRQRVSVLPSIRPSVRSCVTLSFLEQN